MPGAAHHVPPYGPVPGVRPVWLLIGPAVAASLGAFLACVAIGPQWTAIQRDMGWSTSMGVMVLVAFLLPAAVAVAAGVLAGRRWPTAVALPAIALLVIGSLLSTLASGSGLFVFARALTGLGAGLAWGVTAVLVAQLRTQRAWLMPVVAGAVVLALVLGPVAGTLLGQMLGWRWPFMLAVPPGLVAFLITAVSGIIMLTRRASGPAQPPAAP